MTDGSPTESDIQAAADLDAAEERVEELGEEIDEARERARQRGPVEERDEPGTGFTPRTAENPADPDPDEPPDPSQAGPAG